MSRIRHWKERYNFDSPMMFRKCTKFNGEPVSMGDPLTDAHKKLLGPTRVRRWWESGMLCLADNVGRPELKVERVGRAWAKVTYPNGDEVTVRAGKALQELLDAYVPAPVPKVVNIEDPAED